MTLFGPLVVDAQVTDDVLSVQNKCRQQTSAKENAAVALTLKKLAGIADIRHKDIHIRYSVKL